MHVAVPQNLLPHSTFCVGEAWEKQLTALHGVDLGVHCGILLQTKPSCKWALHRKFGVKHVYLQRISRIFQLLDRVKFFADSLWYINGFHMANPVAESGPFEDCPLIGDCR
jgi:hypothetical protein